jgi:hypothetical protein
MEQHRIQGASRGGQGAQADGGAGCKLKDGVMMTVGRKGKKNSSDMNLTLELIFKFQEDPKPKFVSE